MEKHLVDVVVVQMVVGDRLAQDLKKKDSDQQ
jgi:hypothetical protein